MNIKSFDAIQVKDSLFFTKTLSDELKVFYLYDVNNIPLKIKNIVDLNKPTYVLNDKKYNAIYI